MPWFNNSVPRVKRKMKHYDTESVETQLRIMRAHVAGLTTELGNVRVLLQLISQRQADAESRPLPDLCRMTTGDGGRGPCGYLYHPVGVHVCEIGGKP